MKEPIPSNAHISNGALIVENAKIDSYPPKIPNMSPMDEYIDPSPTKSPIIKVAPMNENIEIVSNTTQRDTFSPINENVEIDKSQAVFSSSLSTSKGNQNSLSQPSSQVPCLNNIRFNKSMIGLTGSAFLFIVIVALLFVVRYIWNFGRI